MVFPFEPVSKAKRCPISIILQPLAFRNLAGEAAEEAEA
jgi:hypothetical protein